MDLTILSDILTALGVISILLMVLVVVRRLIGHRGQAGNNIHGKSSTRPGRNP